MGYVTAYSIKSTHFS